ncbi:MAG: MFS transporter [Dehalococcoidales bacterium]|nr:MFS transporter [Dehalococcoidales bacterium]
MAEAIKTDSSKKIWGLHPNVFFVGLTSMLNDVSSEMIFNLLPLFLTNVLGAPMAIVGLVGGVSEGADAIFRMLSGWFSDRIGKRKVLAVSGYTISTLAKPFLLLANAWGVVLAIRFSDRLGKGIRSSSRDALIADSVSPDVRGKAFGLHRSMDTFGAFLGLLIAVLVIWVVLGGGALELTGGVFHDLVWASIIPAVTGVILLQIFVYDVKLKQDPSDTGRSSLSGGKGAFSTRFWLFLAIVAVFNLGSMPHNYFVILRAQDLGAPLLQVMLMLVLFNAVYAVAALPMGILSDRLGRRRILALGWLIYTLVYVGFALSSTIWQIWLAFAFLGIYAAIVEGVSRAFIADLAPAELRGTSYGLYWSVVGISVLIGSIIGGIVWDAIGPAATFYFGAGAAFLAMLGIVTLVRE